MLQRVGTEDALFAGMSAESMKHKKKWPRGSVENWAEQAHKDEVIGQYDAAVIGKEDGKPHVVKRMDCQHIRVIPEWFAGGGGTLPRKELHEAAAQLTANQAGLIAVGEPTIEQGLDKALTRAAKVVKRTVEATTTKSPASCRKRSRANAAAAVEGGVIGGWLPGRGGSAPSP